MLADAFEAAHLGQPEQKRPTPLKMLRSQNPPAIKRLPPTKTATDGSYMVSRLIMYDTYLLDTNTGEHLGRITKQEVVGKNMKRFTTTLGTYIVSPDMSVVKGKYGKQSIFNHTVCIVNAMS